MTQSTASANLFSLEELKEAEEGFRAETGASAEMMDRVMSRLAHPEKAIYNQTVVDPLTFLENPTYMNAGGIMWERVKPHYVEMNSGEYTEALLTGSIGSAKTTLALYTQAYQLYLLSCYKNPHELFDLDPASEIEIVFQNLTATAAKEVDYERFRSMCLRAPYFRDLFPFDKEIESQMRFPRRIVVRHVSGANSGVIGRNLISGVLDEITQMAIVQKSKRSKGGLEGKYDQALSNYSVMSRRRMSRFIQAGGKMPGVLCLSGSRLYPGDFADRKEKERADEIRDKGNSAIYLYDKCTWDVCPPGRFSGKRFRLFTGSDTMQPRKLGLTEKIPKELKHLVKTVPIEFESEFDKDIMDATREIAGCSTAALQPFIVNIELANKCFGRVKSIFNEEEVDFKYRKLHIAMKHVRHKEIPRWCHIDLGQVSDALGLCIGHVRGFRRVRRVEGFHELLPVIVIDGMIRIVAPPGEEVMFHKSRDILYTLRDKLGMNIKWVSLDMWQSLDTRQILRRRGFVTGEISMDRTMAPFSTLKTALYDRRIWTPAHAMCQEEMRGLERNVEKGKVDHRPNGSKDMMDALAGVVFGLSTRREIWLNAGIQMTEIPEEILANAGIARQDRDVEVER